MNITETNPHRVTESVGDTAHVVEAEQVHDDDDAQEHGVQREGQRVLVDYPV